MAEEYFRAYSLAAVTPDVLTTYQEPRLADDKPGNTVHLELALLRRWSPPIHATTPS